MTNKYYNGANNMAASKGNDVHKMPVTYTDDVKHAKTRNVTTTKTTPQSDTTNVKISKDTVTDAVFKGDGV